MRTIRISEAVYKQIAERGKFGETPDDVLRRVFNISEPPRASRTGRGRSPNKATNPMSARVENGCLSVSFQSGHAESWDLPSKGDKEGIRKVRDRACEFAEMNGATEGQVNAVKKALTDKGYHLIK